MGDHLVRWTLGADEEFSILRKSDLGNVDLLNTMPLPDSAANAGTPMPKNIADHEGGQIIHKFDRFEKVKKPGIMTGTSQYMRASCHFLLERDRCDTGRGRGSGCCKG
jgi:hypothetical protein